MRHIIRTRRKRNKEKRFTMQELKKRTGIILDYVVLNDEALITRDGRIIAKLTSYNEKQYLKDITEKINKATEGKIIDD